MKQTLFAWLASLFSGKPDQVQVVGPNSIAIQTNGSIGFTISEHEPQFETSEAIKEPELTELQKLLKGFNPTTDLLTLCRKDYEEYLTGIEEGIMPKVDFDKIISQPAFRNSAIVRCGYGGHFWA